MSIRKSWTLQEDSTLRKIVQSFGNIPEIVIDNLHWNQVSYRLKEELSVYKTPKQCCDRWNNHLKNGTLKEPEWSSEQQTQLFQLQEKLGNKWTVIAQQLFKSKDSTRQLVKKSDSIVKNYFYATLRKSIRMINNFISQHRNEGYYKSCKTFPGNCIGKIVAQDQQKKINKMRVTKDNISLQAKYIKSLLWNISRESSSRELIEEAIQKISEFNRSCRRLRCKKKKNTSAQFEVNCIQKKSSSNTSIKNTKQEDEMNQMENIIKDHSCRKEKVQCSFISGQLGNQKQKNNYKNTSKPQPLQLTQLKESLLERSENFSVFNLHDPLKKKTNLKMECEGGIKRICESPQIFLPPHQLHIGDNLRQQYQYEPYPSNNQEDI